MVQPVPCLFSGRGRTQTPSVASTTSKASESMSRGPWADSLRHAIASHVHVRPGHATAAGTDSSMTAPVTGGLGQVVQSHFLFHRPPVQLSHWVSLKTRPYGLVGCCSRSEIDARTAPARWERRSSHQASRCAISAASFVQVSSTLTAAFPRVRRRANGHSRTSRGSPATTSSGR